MSDPGSRVAPDPKRRMKVSTRPQDWTPATRVHLFGWETLSPAEREDERRRMSYGRLKYGVQR